MSPDLSNQMTTAHFTLLHEAVRVVIALCWIALGIALLLRRRMQDAPKRIRSRIPMVGPGLQSAGTTIHIRTGEKLLRETFGQEFEACARRVPALFPRLRRDS